MNIYRGEGQHSLKHLHVAVRAKIQARDKIRAEWFREHGNLQIGIGIG